MESSQRPRSPRYAHGIDRIVDICHHLRTFPGEQPQPPPPPFPHLEPFGSDISTRGRAFEHLKVEPFCYTDSLESISAMVTISTQMNPQLEGPYPGYLPQHLYGDLDPALKAVPKDVANYPLAQLVTSCALIDVPTEPGGHIPLRRVRERAGHLQYGDAVVLRTGFLDQHPDSYDWPNLEPGITQWLAEEKGCLLFGIDSSSVEGSGGGHEPIPNHMGMFLVGGVNLEGLANLDAVTVPRFYLMALPLRISGLDAGPCRVLAVWEEEDRRRVVDLSPVVGAKPGVGPSRPPYPKWEPFEEKNATSKRLRIDPFHVDNTFEDIGMFVAFNAHLGTHVEIPRSIGSANVAEEYDIASFPADRLMGEATILDVPVGPGGKISAAHLAQCDVEPQHGDIAVVRTGYSDWYYGRSDFYDLSPSLAPNASEWLLDHGVSAVATDMAALDPQKPRSGIAPIYDSLSLFFGAGVPVVSNLTNIDQILSQRPFLACAPLRIEGLYSCPVRAIAVEWV